MSNLMFVYRKTGAEFSCIYPQILTPLPTPHIDLYYVKISILHSGVISCQTAFEC